MAKNSADRQSLQFTINEILFKIFGAMSKDTYSEFSKYFGIEPCTRRGDWCSQGQIFEEVLCNRQLLMPSD